MIWQARSIRQHLVFIVVSTTLVALGVALVGNAVINVLAFRNFQAADLSTQAAIAARRDGARHGECRSSKAKTASK